MRVNFDSKMLGDSRFKKLGRRVGINHFEAYGRCYPVWNAAYENRSALMDLGDIDALAECEGFGAAMLEVDLAVDEGSGPRLRGVRDRILWLLGQDAKREMANEAKRNAHAKRRGNSPHPSPGASSGRSRGSFPGDVPEGVPLQEQEQEQEQETLPPDQGSGAPDLRPIDRAERSPRAIPPSTPPTTNHAPSWDERVRQLVTRAWNFATTEHNAFRAEHVDPDTTNAWAGLRSADDATMRACRARVEEQVLRFSGDFDEAEAKIRNRIAVAFAEARRDRRSEFVIPARMWNESSFAIAVDLSPQQAARPRPGPSSPHATRPVEVPRKIPTAR